MSEEDPQMKDNTLLALAKDSGDPWTVDNPYFENNEFRMPGSWKKIYPIIQHCDFSRTVEFAAGHGRNSEYLRQHANELFLLDVHECNVEFCRERFAGDPTFHYAVNNGFDLQPVPNEWATFVYCFDAMVHFDSDVIRAYLADILRVLSPGGMCFLHHSNYTGGHYWRKNPHSRAFMSADQFRHYAIKEGLEPVEQQVVKWGTVENLDCFSLLRKPLRGETICLSQPGMWTERTALPLPVAEANALREAVDISSSCSATLDLSSLIIVCAAQRSGTTVLQKTLSAGTRFETFGEVFHESPVDKEINFFEYLQQEQISTASPFPTAPEQRKLFDRFFSHLMQRRSKKWLFVDIKYNSFHHLNPVWHDHLGTPFLLALLKERRVKVLHIVRRNVFEQVLSSLIAHAISVWHADHQRVITLPRISIDPNEVIERMSALQKLQEFYTRELEEYPDKQLLFYEEMCCGDRLSPACVEAVEALTKEPYAGPLDTALQRINPRPQDVVQNSEEVVAFFENTPFSEMVESSLTANS